MNKVAKLNILINWCFLLYFLILFGERIYSLIYSFMDGLDYAFGTFMRGAYIVIVMASLLISFLLLIIFNRDFLIALLTNKKVNYKNLCLTMGVTLVAGMIHTDHTILYIQFIAYGFLIIALFLETLIVRKDPKKNRVLLWASFFYLIAYSMAIPVNYIIFLDGHPLFHSLQLVTTLIMILSFVYMCGKLFAGEGEHLFYFTPMVYAVLGDVFILVFRWSEYINWFLLIALTVTIFLFMLGKILESRYRKEETEEY